MATSTVPALKAGLVTMLQNRVGLTGVNVSYGPPLPNPTSEYVWVGDVTGSQSWGAMAIRSEEYDLKVVHGVDRGGTDQQAPTERAFALLAELEAAVRADPTIGGVVNTSSAQITQIDLVELVRPDGSGRLSEVTATVNVSINRI